MSAGSAGQQTQLIRILEDLLKLPENKECVDCGTKAPRWASTNLGVFMCIRCSGIHRSLGVHISKVKSVSLDKWTPEQVEFMKRMGNAKGKDLYESYVPASYNKGDIRTENIALEQWIRDKYERKRFIRRDGAEPITRSEYKERDRQPRDNKDHREREPREREPREREPREREPREQPHREQPREHREQPREVNKPLQAPHGQATRPVTNNHPNHPAPINVNKHSAGTAPAQSFDLLNWDEPAPAPQPAPTNPIADEDLFGDFNSAAATGPGAPPTKDKNAILSLYHTPQQPLVSYHPGGPYPVMHQGYPGAPHPGQPNYYPGAPHPGQPYPGQHQQFIQPGPQYPGPPQYPGATYPAPNYNIHAGAPPHMQAGAYNNGPHPGYPQYHGAPAGGQPNHYNPHPNPNGGYNSAPNAYNNNPNNTNNMINGLNNLNLRM